MQKILSVLIAAAFLAVLTPGVNAETVTEEYTGAIGASVMGVGPALVLFPNSDESIFTQNGIRPIGGVRLNAEGFYNNAIVTPSDDVYGSGAAVSICFWNPDGDNVCDDDDFGSGRVCGVVPLLNAPFAGNYVTVFVFTLLVSEDLETCGGSTGSVTGDFF